MKLLKKLTYKDLKDKKFEEIYDLSVEELKYTDKESLIKILCQTRSKLIEEQKQRIEESMKKDVEWQLELIKIIKDAKTSEKIRQKAFEDVIAFLDSQEVIISKELLKETYYLRF